MVIKLNNQFFYAGHDLFCQQLFEEWIVFESETKIIDKISPVSVQVNVCVTSVLETHFEFIWNRRIVELRTMTEGGEPERASDFWCLKVRTFFDKVFDFYETCLFRLHTKNSKRSEPWSWAINAEVRIYSSCAYGHTGNISRIRGVVGKCFENWLLIFVSKDFFRNVFKTYLFPQTTDHTPVVQVTHGFALGHAFPVFWSFIWDDPLKTMLCVVDGRFH